jgi:hypothetical protein
VSDLSLLRPIRKPATCVCELPEWFGFLMDLEEVCEKFEPEFEGDLICMHCEHELECHKENKT